MGGSQAGEIQWYQFVPPRERHNLLRILEELSHLFQQEPSFIIVGAFSLLIRGVLSYTVLWDLDLLFKDRRSMEKFVEAPKSPNLRIQHLDPDLMVGETISSIHTAWRITQSWFNVDYILLPGDFDFYHANQREEITLASEVTLEDKKFSLNLRVAAPWDVMVKKLLSPRLNRDLESRDILSVDLRHVFHLLLKFQGDLGFWRRVAQKAKYLGRLEQIKGNLLRVISLKDEVGYREMGLAPGLCQTVSRLS